MTDTVLTVFGVLLVAGVPAVLAFWVTYLGRKRKQCPRCGAPLNGRFQLCYACGRQLGPKNPSIKKLICFFLLFLLLWVILLGALVSGGTYLINWAAAFLGLR